MKIEKTERFEEYTVLLEEGIDYQFHELVVTGMGLLGRGISAPQLTTIAVIHGFNKWSWTSTLYPDDQGLYPKELKVIFRKRI